MPKYLLCCCAAALCILPQPQAKATAIALAAPAASSAAPPVIYDTGRLPPPVRAMRERLLQAAKSGNIEALRPLLSYQPAPTQLLPAGTNGDPIAYLKEISADGRGLEILANIIRILQTGSVHLNSGSKDDVYLWPYLAAYAPQNLSESQQVEAYTIMNVDDLDTIKEIGHYVYFRLGIAPDGRWRFFLTGEDSAYQDKQNTEETENIAPALPNHSDTLPAPDDSDDLAQ